MKFSLELNVKPRPCKTLSSGLSTYRTPSRIWVRSRLVKSERPVLTPIYQSIKRIELATRAPKLGSGLALSPRTLLTLSNKAGMTLAEKKELHRLAVLSFLIDQINVLLGKVVHVQSGLFYLNLYSYSLRRPLFRSITVRKLSPQRSIGVLSTHLTTKL